MINPAKYVFSQPKVEFLGYLVGISGEGTRPLPEHVRAIQGYQMPKIAKIFGHS